MKANYKPSECFVNLLNGRASSFAQEGGKLLPDPNSSNNKRLQIGASQQSLSARPKQLGLEVQMVFERDI